MPTLVVIDGFEHGVRSTAGGFYNDAAGGTFSTTNVRSGTRSFLSDNSFENVRYAITPLEDCVGVVYFKVSATPSAERTIVRATSGGRNFRISIDTNREIAALIHDGTSEKARVTRTGALTVDTWYRVDYKFKTNAGGGSTYTIDWQLALGDGIGISQSQVSSVEAAGQTVSQIRIGEGETTMICHYDDVAISQTAADYPIGPIKVLGYRVASNGTHNLDAATSAYFFKDIGGTETMLTSSETNSYLAIDDQPIDADTDHIGVRGAIADTARYTEHTFADSVESGTPLGVAAMVTLLQDTAAACSITAKLRANGNESNIYSGDINSATNIYKRAFFATAPGGAAWTNAIINGATVRFGYTNDAAGTPRMAAAFMEVAYAANITFQTARPLTTITTNNWRTQAAGTDLHTSLDEIIYDDTDYIKSASSPASADISEVKLSSLSDPQSSSGHIIRYRYKKSAPSGDQLDLTVRLVQGTTIIASWIHTNIDAETIAEQLLNNTQADSITDYTDLRLRFEIVKP